MYDRASKSSTSAALLGRLLGDLRPARASYCLSEVTRPWSIGLPRQQGVRLHFVVEGFCWLSIDGTAPERLDEGDVVLLPHGTGHRIGDRATSAAPDIVTLGLEPLSGTSFRLRAGGGGARSLVVCCTVDFDHPSASLLLAAMPRVLVVRDAGDRHDRLRALLALMGAEAAEERLGSATVLARLADAAIVQILRDWAETRGAETGGWLAALNDPALARALLALHDRPGEAWTLARMASAAGLSRSAFAARFAAVLGRPPANYVTHWRMRLARQWLRERVPVAEVAARLGYASEASFGRAFKRATGASPGSLRRAPEAPAQPATPVPIGQVTPVPPTPQ